MKTIILFLVFLFSFLNELPAQSKDAEARYAYAEAEKAFNELKYEESIKYCDDAASNLGKTNSKILYLKLKCFQKLLEQDCTNTVLNKDSQLLQSIKLFFDLTNDSNYPQDKYFEIVELKKKYENIKANGCPKKMTIKSANDEIDASEVKTVYDSRLKVTSLDNKPIEISNYKGKKILIVNTATKSGYAHQFGNLEKLYEQYKSNLVVIGFPSNDFADQEPSSNEEIKDYVKRNYGVTFPMSKKIYVKGENGDPLFKYLISEAKKMGMDNPVKWNFTKFLLDENGKLIAVFESKIDPLDEQLVQYLK